jgi:hypothetical protein
VATLPITDESVYPTLGGTQADGYDIVVEPGISGAVATNRLNRTEVAEIVGTTMSVEYEWIQFACQLHVRDGDDVVVPGSTLSLPVPFGALSHGDSVTVPVNDPATYPTLGGYYVTGYPITVTPGEIAPTSETIDFRKLASGAFEPATFEIGGNTYHLACELPSDSDNDGLTDEEEATLGTDPNDPDSDDDGLLDGTEVDMADGSGCPDPLNPDSDGDTLLDGAEVAQGTSPCDPDTDGDGVADNYDPDPLVPDQICHNVEQMLRDTATEIGALDLALLRGANPNAKEGRRNALANRATAAANIVSQFCQSGGQTSLNGAINTLENLLDKVDGDVPSPDWMDESPEKATLAAQVQYLISLIKEMQQG